MDGGEPGDLTYHVNEVLEMLEERWVGVERKGDVEGAAVL